MLTLAILSSCGSEPRPADPRPPEPRPAIAEPELSVPPRAPWYDPQPEPPVPARFRDPVAARYHMRAHFGDLRMIEQLLVAGKLDEGLALSYLLTRKLDDPGLEPWADHARGVVDAATSLTTAPGLDEALRREARVAVACAGCHIATPDRPLFGAVPALPPDRPTPHARMARHVWATDRLWESLIAGDDERWGRGLSVLAGTPLPFAPLTDAPMLAAQLQRFARGQLAARNTSTLDERGTAYGEMLVVCAACHASLHAKLTSAGAISGSRTPAAAAAR